MCLRGLFFRIWFRCRIAEGKKSKRIIFWLPMKRTYIKSFDCIFVFVLEFALVFCVCCIRVCRSWSAYPWIVWSVINVTASGRRNTYRFGKFNDFQIKKYRNALRGPCARHMLSPSNDYPSFIDARQQFYLEHQFDINYVMIAVDSQQPMQAVSIALLTAKRNDQINKKYSPEKWYHFPH